MECGVGSPTAGGKNGPMSGWLGIFIALGLCGFSLHRSWGQFEPVACVAMVLSVVMGWIVLIRESFSLDSLFKPSIGISILAVVASLALWFKPNVYHFLNLSGFEPIRLATFGATLALVALIQVVELLGKKRWAPLIYTATCLSILFAAGLVIGMVPRPAIDVHLFNTMAAQATLQFQNMYQLEYPDIYGGAYAFKPCFPYLPGTLLWSVPGWLWGDVRWGLWLFLGLSMLLVSQFKFKKAEILFLCPVIFYLIECSLVDLGLLPLFLAGLFSLKKERWILSGFMFGLAAGGKQYAFLPLVFSSIATFFLISRRAGATIFITGITTATVTVLPWLINAPEVFISSTFWGLLAVPPRADALTLFALVKYFGLGWSKWLGLFVGLGGLLGACFFLSRRVVGQSLVFRVSLASGCVYGIVFLFGSQAFGNYYFLVYLFFCIALLEALSPIPAETSPQAKLKTG